MRALLLAHYFPPDGGPGAQRPIAFARHLPGAGVDVTVLTRAVPTDRGYFDPADPETLAEIASRCEIVRAGPATTMGELIARLIEAGNAAIARQRPDVILVTMSPFELWRVAETLGRRHRIPAVADLRDPWALDGVLDYRTRIHWHRERRRMRAMLRSADGVVANTCESAKLFRDLVPDLDAERVTVVTNGWDRKDFDSPPPEVPPGETMRLVYGGSFLCGELYQHERWIRRLLGWLRYRPEPILPSGRTPRHLLAALRLLRERGSAAASEVRFVAIGQIDDSLRRCVAESGVEDLVELLPYRTHGELIAAIRSADALFLTLHGLPPGHRSRIVPGKTYEYLATGRPILAALPEGDARELVAQSPRAALCDPCDEEGIATALERLHGKWKAGDFVRSSPPDAFAGLERAILCRKLSDFLRSVIDRPMR